MSDVNLLVFGCVVAFIGVAGAYMYVSESFTADERTPRESEMKGAKAVEQEIIGGH